MFLCGNFALKPLQIGEIMSNNEIMQFSYIYWKSSEKKADEKINLVPRAFPLKNGWFNGKALETKLRENDPISRWNLP